MPALLLFSSRTWENVIFRDELLALAARNDGFQLALSLTRDRPRRPQDFGRRVGADMVAELVRRLPRSPRHVFVCGGNPFVEAASQGALPSSIDRSLIRTERYGADAQAKGAAANSDPSLQRAALVIPTPWSSRLQASDWAWTYRQQTSHAAPSSAPLRRSIGQRCPKTGPSRSCRPCWHSPHQRPEALSFAQPRRPKCRRCPTMAGPPTWQCHAFTPDCVGGCIAKSSAARAGVRPSKTAAAVPISKRFMLRSLLSSCGILATGHELFFGAGATLPDRCQ